MNEDIRRWVQTAVGIAVLAYGVLHPSDTHRLWIVALGGGLIDAEHALKAMGIWKGVK
jgi:hypothetical protein